MTEQEFLRYKGLKTNGSHGGHNFEGGSVVGYRKNYKPTDFQSFIAFFNDDRGWNKADMSEEISFDDKGFFLGERPNGTFLCVSLDNLVIETEKEEKELDLTEILEGCEGVELWSDIFGKCKLYGLHGDDDYIIEVSVLNTISSEVGYESFTKYGKYYDCYPNGKCMLWPSETCRDWSEFKKPINLKEGDWVMCGLTCRNVVLRKYKCEDKCYSREDRTLKWPYIAPFEKYDPNLSDEELKKLSIV